MPRFPTACRVMLARFIVAPPCGTGAIMQEVSGVINALEVNWWETAPELQINSYDICFLLHTKVS